MGSLEFLFSALLRRPGISAALSLAVVSFIILMSQFKFGITWMTLTFLDVLVIDSDTFYFLVQIFPVLRIWLVAGALIFIPGAILIWWIDPFRDSAADVVGGGPRSVSPESSHCRSHFPNNANEPFQGINHVSSFSRSGVYAVSQLLAQGWIDADDKVSDPVPMRADAACRPDAEAAEHHR